MLDVAFSRRMAARGSARQAVRRVAVRVDVTPNAGRQGALEVVAAGHVGACGHRRPSACRSAGCATTSRRRIPRRHQQRQASSRGDDEAACFAWTFSTSARRSSMRPLVEGTAQHGEQSPPAARSIPRRFASTTSMPAARPPAPPRWSADGSHRDDEAVALAADAALASVMASAAAVASSASTRWRWASPSGRTPWSGSSPALPSALADLRLVRRVSVYQAGFSRTWQDDAGREGAVILADEAAEHLVALRIVLSSASAALP